VPTVNRIYRVELVSNDGQFSITFCKIRSTDSEVDTGEHTNTRVYKQRQNFVSLILLALKGGKQTNEMALIKVDSRAGLFYYSSRCNSMFVYMQARRVRYSVSKWNIDETRQYSSRLLRHTRRTVRKYIDKACTNTYGYLPQTLNMNNS